MSNHSLKIVYKLKKCKKAKQVNVYKQTLDNLKLSIHMYNNAHGANESNKKKF
jgi:hypothetical protein